jgi:hypothetical protein
VEGADRRQQAAVVRGAKAEACGSDLAMIIFELNAQCLADVFRGEDWVLPESWCLEWHF